MAGGALPTILVPVRGDGKGDNVLAHAAVVARRFGSRVRVVHSRPKAEDYMPFGLVVPRVVKEQLAASAKSTADTATEQLAAEFRELIARFGLKEQDRTPGVATARFIGYDGKQVKAVRHYGRLADLICVPQPDRDLNLGINTLKTALFSSGRPVMMCPPQDKVADDFPDRVAIGWNGSLEASRAVALAMPLIENASEVTILTGGHQEDTATPEELRRYFELRDVAATIRTFEVSGTAGSGLLREAEACNAGLLVMGAYQDSFERESVFGGNSQTVVDGAKIPVVMVH